MADLRLLDAAHHIFDTLVTELTAQGIVVPDRRYVTTGLVAADFAGTNCADAFIVSWTNTYSGIPGREIDPYIKCSMPLTAQFSIILFRCVPTLTSSGAAPTPDKMEDSSDVLLTDAWTIPATIVSETISGLLRQERIDLIAITGVNSIGPQGGVGGCETVILATIL